MRAPTEAEPPLVHPSDRRANEALARVDGLAVALVDALRAVSPTSAFPIVRWARDDGRHGGGFRRANAGDATFDRASVNVSLVHYDDESARPLAFAAALSAIVHPRNPHAPSLHLHVSLTALRSGTATWRIMADLNPSHPEEADRDAFMAALRRAAPDAFDRARAAGDRYFFIPVLGRTRGIAHFYLESEPDSGDSEQLATAVAEAAIGAYGDALARRAHTPFGAESAATQLAYHTLYLFQVLTLDRGTTAGLLVHDQNDLGILGSLPSKVDPHLLRSWADRAPPAVRPWVDTIATIVADGEVGDAEKRALAEACRAFYRAHPDALAFQAESPRQVGAAENHGSRR